MKITHVFKSCANEKDLAYDKGYKQKMSKALR